MRGFIASADPSAARSPLEVSAAGGRENRSGDVASPAKNRRSSTRLGQRSDARSRRPGFCVGIVSRVKGSIPVGLGDGLQPRAYGLEPNSATSLVDGEGRKGPGPSCSSSTSQVAVRKKASIIGRPSGRIEWLRSEPCRCGRTGGCPAGTPPPPPAPGSGLVDMAEAGRRPPAACRAAAARVAPAASTAVGRQQDGGARLDGPQVRFDFQGRAAAVDPPDGRATDGGQALGQAGDQRPVTPRGPAS